MTCRLTSAYIELRGDALSCERWWLSVGKSGPHQTGAAGVSTSGIGE